MVNKIVSVSVLLLMCGPLPSLAYVIGSDLTIENKTSTPMEISINPPNGQDSITQIIPPYQTTTIYVENGDETVWLYQTSVAPFSIKDATKKTEYVNGRVAYYVGGAFWSKYSFLDSVTGGEGISLDKTFSCANGGNGTVFQNKIVLSGEPGDPAPANSNREVVRCEGLRSSNLRDGGRDYYGDIKYYDVTCSDNSVTTFWRALAGIPFPRRSTYRWTNGEMEFSVDRSHLREKGLKFALDEGVGGGYCQTWEKKL